MRLYLVNTRDEANLPSISFYRKVHGREAAPRSIVSILGPPLLVVICLFSNFKHIILSQEWWIHLIDKGNLAILRLSSILYKIMSLNMIYGGFGSAWGIYFFTAIIALYVRNNRNSCVLSTWRVQIPDFVFIWRNNVYSGLIFHINLKTSHELWRMHVIAPFACCQFSSRYKDVRGSDYMKSVWFIYLVQRKVRYYLKIY